MKGKHPENLSVEFKFCWWMLVLSELLFIFASSNLNFVIMKSVYVSVASLIAAVVTLFYIVCIGTETSHASMLVAVLGILVTALIAWNIIQYIFAENRMKELASKTSSEAIKDLTDDFKHIMLASDPLSHARMSVSYSLIGIAIHRYFQTLKIYLNIKDANLHYNCVSVLLGEILPLVEDWKSEGVLVVHKDYLPDYLELLDNCDTPQTTKLKELLSDVETIEGKKETSTIQGSDVTVTSSIP